MASGHLPAWAAAAWRRVARWKFVWAGKNYVCVSRVETNLENEPEKSPTNLRSRLGGATTKWNPGRARPTRVSVQPCSLTFAKLYLTESPSRRARRFSTLVPWPFLAGNGSPSFRRHLFHGFHDLPRFSSRSRRAAPPITATFSSRKPGRAESREELGRWMVKKMDGWMARRNVAGEMREIEAGDRRIDVVASRN